MRRGGEGVPVVGGFGEVVGQLFEVDLFLLSAFEQLLQGHDVRFHVPQAAEVVALRVLLQARQPFGGGLHALREAVHGGFDAGFEHGELHELGREVEVVCFEVGFTAGDAGDDLLDVGEVFVQLVGFFADVDEAFVWLVDFGEGVHEGVGEVVEDGRAGFGGGGAAAAVGSHVRVPVRGLEEGYERELTAEERVECKAADEAVERVGAALGEIWTKAVAADVFQFVLVWERGDGVGGELLAKGFVEKDEISESAADTEGGFLKRGKVALMRGQYWDVDIAGRGGAAVTVMNVRVS